MKNQKPKPITTKLDRSPEPRITLGGWCDGRKGTYLWFGDEAGNHCMGILSGAQLIRLARRIVREFDKSADPPPEKD